MAPAQATALVPAPAQRASGWTPGPVSSRAVGPPAACAAQKPSATGRAPQLVPAERARQWAETEPVLSSVPWDSACLVQPGAAPAARQYRRSVDLRAKESRRLEPQCFRGQGWECVRGQRPFRGTVIACPHHKAL